MSEPLINCISCMKDECENCLHPDSCLCSVESNHNKKVVQNYGVWDDDKRDNFKLEMRNDSLENFKNEKMNEDDRIDEAVHKIRLYYEFVTRVDNNELYLFNGKIYSSEGAVSKIKELSEKLIPNCSEHQRNEVIAKIKAQTYKDITFDSDPNLLTLNNGVLHLDTLILTEHNPENYSRVLIPVEFIQPKGNFDEAIFENIEANLKDTLFWRALRECFTIEGKFDKKSFESVLEMMACAFIKRQIDDKAWINQGAGNNGKSKFLEYLESLLGSENVSNLQLQQLSEDRFAPAELEGKLANIFSDIESTELKKTNMIKAITSSDSMSVQRKHGQLFKIKPFCKCIFSCNRLPMVFDNNEGFFRRWKIIHWLRDFECDKIRDENLGEKLKANQEEKNFVFSCLITLANKINKNGKLEHTDDWKTIQKEWNKNADPIDDFVCNNIIESDGNKTKRETYEFYKEWCLKMGERVLKFKQFNDRFAEYYDEYRSNAVRQWQNIDFVEPKNAKLNEFSE